MKYIKKITTRILSLSTSIVTLVLFPVVSFAQENPLIPCDGTAAHPCGFDELLGLVGAIINFILGKMVLPIAAILLAYVGFLYLSSGSNPANRTKAKEILWKLVVGLVIALAAWLIVRTILVTLGYDDTIFPRIM
jgi:hypothetical protein